MSDAIHDLLRLSKIPNKPKVLLAILTGIERHNWVNPELSANLFNMAKDPRFDVVYYPVCDARPWEAARNLTILAAKQTNADWLLSMDNDGFYPNRPHTPLDIIAQAGEKQRVIGPYFRRGRSRFLHAISGESTRRGGRRIQGSGVRWRRHAHRAQECLAETPGGAVVSMAASG